VVYIHEENGNRSAKTAKTFETEQDKLTDGTRARYSQVKHMIVWIPFLEATVI
jgi:hypothetical protein